MSQHFRVENRSSKRRKFVNSQRQTTSGAGLPDGKFTNVPKIPIWVIFGEPWNMNIMLVYVFLAIWYILCKISWYILCQF
jgi:hypothetical protein